MAIASILDTRCSVNPNIASSIKTSDSLAVFGAGAPLEISISLFQVLMAFAEIKTPRQVFESMELDVGIDEFIDLINKFIIQDLLKCEPLLEPGYGFRGVVNPKIFLDPSFVGKINNWMSQGRAVVVHDALPIDFAEEVHRELDSSDHWRVREGNHDFFHYRNTVIEQLEGKNQILTRCSKLFTSFATRQFITELAGVDCSGQAHAAAAWYRPGDYALPHDDSVASDPRSVAYIWYLTKEWQRKWGGALFWCPTGQYICPQFNVLVMFKVLPTNIHMVCPVSPATTGKRLSINGFWSYSGAPVGARAISADARVSARVYGSPPLDDMEALPVFAL